MASKEVTDDSCVDIASVARKVWLIKVPKYLSKRLESAQPMQEIGRIKINSDCNRNESPEIVFNISKELAECTDKSSDDKENEPNIPVEHQFCVSKLESQTMTVFSQNFDSKRISFEGSVTQKGECRPMVSSRYISLNRERMKKALQPLRSVQQLDRTVCVFKPADHRLALTVKKAEPMKKCKEDRETVRNMLFKIFEKHQYYNMSDLERLTLQPLYYLKEIVREVCNYNNKNPHKYMWELKPEYRHYSDSLETDD